MEDGLDRSLTWLKIQDLNNHFKHKKPETNAIHNEKKTTVADQIRYKDKKYNTNTK